MGNISCNFVHPYLWTKWTLNSQRTHSQLQNEYQYVLFLSLDSMCVCPPKCDCVYRWHLPFMMWCWSDVYLLMVIYITSWWRISSKFPIENKGDLVHFHVPYNQYVRPWKVDISYLSQTLRMRSFSIPGPFGPYVIWFHPASSRSWCCLFFCFPLLACGLCSASKCQSGRVPNSECVAAVLVASQLFDRLDVNSQNSRQSISAGSNPMIIRDTYLESALNLRR